MKQKNYDYYLIILTSMILLSIGVVCIYGITYYNYLAINPDWTRSIRYEQFIGDMNSYLFPFLVLLLICVGLCIPKRLFEQNILIKFSASVMILTAILTLVNGIEIGLGFILAIMTGVQIIVLILTLNKSIAIRFEKEGYLNRLGSSLLHLGIVVLILNFVMLRESSFHIIIFWSGMLLITAGNVFSFYPDKVASLLHYE